VIQSECEIQRPTAARAVKIIRAAHWGMCFGVRDAIEMARDRNEATPVTILGELAHNGRVLADLRARGIRMAERVEEVGTEAVMITAHGAADRTVEALKERGLRVLEATCPLVHYAHRAVKALVREGFHPVIIGRREHVEVRGLTGDLAEFDVVLTEEDVMELAERARFGVAAQTTQPIDRVRYLVGVMRRRFAGAEVRFVDTVCQPTKQRQAAAIELASQVDVVIVVGGANSNNTRELAATCRRFCLRVHQAADAGDVRAEWVADAETVGLTAGTSTPDEVVDEVEARVREISGES